MDGAGGAEDDYMSDAFVKGLEDVRPGLKPRKRKDQSPKVQEAAIPKAKQRKMQESAAREAGLSKPLSAENKGFSMLRKMGYKEGAGLGKSGGGIKTPLFLQVKEGRDGLGRECYLREKTVEKKEKEVRGVLDFRQRKQESFSQRRVLLDLKKSQTACEELDTKLGISVPKLQWFWPPSGHQDDAETVEEEEEEEEEYYEDDEEAEPTDSEKLDFLTQYLRIQHCYCIWCGIAFGDDVDMSKHCPGDAAELHD